MASESSSLKRSFEEISKPSNCTCCDSSDDEDEDTSHYAVNQTYTAYENDPPKPFAGSYRDNWWPDEYPNPTWDGKTKEQYCMERPPLCPKAGGKTMELKITSRDLSSNEDGPWVVEVNHTMVAKIFDPLYYEHINKYNNKQPIVWKADGAYSREAAAYLYLTQGSKKAENGKSVKDHIPEFYGCYTINVETENGLTRQVPLILMEKMQGKCLKYVRPRTLRQRQRCAILRKVFEAEALIFDVGVKHNDIAPRNVFFDRQNWQDPDAIIKIIDFDQARVYAQDTTGEGVLGQLHKLYPGKIVSPIPHMENDSALGELAAFGWLPIDMDKALQWLINHMLTDQYTPVKPDKRGIYQYEGLKEEDDSDEEEEEREQNEKETG